MQPKFERIGIYLLSRRLPVEERLFQERGLSGGWRYIHPIEQ